MGTISANKILAHLDRVMGDQKPITADVFLTNYCNNACSYCTYKRWELDDDAYSMPFEDFVPYAIKLNELGVLGIILTGGGEPTIAKDFGRIVSWLDGNGIKWGINTNFNRYFEGSPEYLKVSLDAWDEDSYQKRRGVRAYNTVRENINRFVRNKPAHTKMGIQQIARTVEEVYRFYDANADLPVNYISIRPVESTNGEYYLGHDPGGVIQAIKALQAVDRRVVRNYKWDMLHTRQSTCTAQWSQIAINEKGEVMYCCHKPFQIIGHIMDDDILEKKARAKTDMKLCDVPCRLTAPNHTVAQINRSQTNAEFI